MPKSSKKEESSLDESLIRTPENEQKKFSFISFLSGLLGKTKDTIKQLKPSSKRVNLEEKDILNNFLKFSSKTVEDIMIPRSDISGVKYDIKLEELNQVIVKFPHTRTLVYEDTLDNIVGFIHIKDIFKVLAKKQNFQLKKLLRKHIIAAHSMRLITLLQEMQEKRTHIAIVVDEYGGTDGIITSEDIVEEVFGRIDDEHDEKLASDSYKILDSNTIVSSSRVKVEELEILLGVQLKNDNDEFDTIGGLVLAKVGNVPVIGTKIEITNQIELEVIEATPRTLKKVKLKLKNEQHLPTKTAT
jgi:CBS domain containing-hemolysin-like protein